MAFIQNLISPTQYLHNINIISKFGTNSEYINHYSNIVCIDTEPDIVKKEFDYLKSFSDTEIQSYINIKQYEVLAHSHLDKPFVVRKSILHQYKFVNIKDLKIPLGFFDYKVKIYQSFLFHRKCPMFYEYDDIIINFLKKLYDDFIINHNLYDIKELQIFNQWLILIHLIEYHMPKQHIENQVNNALKLYKDNDIKINVKDSLNRVWVHLEKFLIEPNLSEEEQLQLYNELPYIRYILLKEDARVFVDFEILENNQKIQQLHRKTSIEIFFHGTFQFLKYKNIVKEIAIFLIMLRFDCSIGKNRHDLTKIINKDFLLATIFIQNNQELVQDLFAECNEYESYNNFLTSLTELEEDLVIQNNKIEAIERQISEGTDEDNNRNQLNLYQIDVNKIKTTISHNHIEYYKHLLQNLKLDQKWAICLSRVIVPNKDLLKDRMDKINELLDERESEFESNIQL
jgi:hypothetical protein